MKMLRGSCVLAFSLTCAAPAFAGLVDTPLAAPFTQLVYSVTGVRNLIASPLATIFSCTSTATVPITVGVDVFNNLGAPASGLAPLPVAPGHTVVFATTPVPSVVVDLVLPAVPGITNGSARIVSTSKSLICSAAVVDVGANPPRTMVQLTIVAKTKQKAAN